MLTCAPLMAPSHSEGHLFNMEPFIEPAANMVFTRNIFHNITSVGAGDKLDYSISGTTTTTLAHSGSLQPFKNYGFEHGAPPGWPELSLNDTVIKQWDLNLYNDVQGFSTSASAGAHGWDNRSIFADPLFLRQPGSQPWNRTCHDYMPAPSSPAWKQGFQPIDTSNLGPCSSVVLVLHLFGCALFQLNVEVVRVTASSWGRAVFQRYMWRLHC